ncbi:MAG: hypothetical protein WCF95_06415 [bacterium]
MHISQIMHEIVSPKITSVKDLEKILKAEHTKKGDKFLYKFQLNQDVFEQAIKGKETFEVPKDMFLKLNVRGKQNVNLQIGEGAVFEAPKAIFQKTVTKGKKTLIGLVDGDLYSSGSGITKTKGVKGDAVSSDKSTLKSDIVVKNAYAFGESQQEFNKVYGNAETGGKAVQTSRLIGKNAKSKDESIQRAAAVKGNVLCDDSSKQAFEIVGGSATVTGKGVQNLGFVQKEALCEFSGTQNIVEIGGKATCTVYGDQRIHKTYGETEKSADAIQEVLERVEK